VLVLLLVGLLPPLKLALPQKLLAVQQPLARRLAVLLKRVLPKLLAVQQLLVVLLAVQVRFPLLMLLLAALVKQLRILLLLLVDTAAVQMLVLLLQLQVIYQKQDKGQPHKALLLLPQKLRQQ
jgi:hypothetical protein